MHLRPEADLRICSSLKNILSLETQPRFLPQNTIHRTAIQRPPLSGSPFPRLFQSPQRHLRHLQSTPYLPRTLYPMPHILNRQPNITPGPLPLRRRIHPLRQLLTDTPRIRTIVPHDQLLQHLSIQPSLLGKDVCLRDRLGQRGGDEVARRLEERGVARRGGDVDDGASEAGFDVRLGERDALGGTGEREEELAGFRDGCGAEDGRGDEVGVRGGEGCGELGGGVGVDGRGVDYGFVGEVGPLSEEAGDGLGYGGVIGELEAQVVRESL